MDDKERKGVGHGERLSGCLNLQEEKIKVEQSKRRIKVGTRTPKNRLGGWEGQRGPSAASGRWGALQNRKTQATICFYQRVQ